jgi:ATP-dependent Clp protease ATP-binding subunit ClpA
MQLEVQLADRQVTIELTDEARKWLADKGYDQRFGARPLARVIQEHIKRHLAEELLFGRLVKGGVVQVGLKDGQLTFDYAEAGQESPPSGKKRKSRQPADAP